MQAALPLLLKAPGAQGRQLLVELAPGVVLKLPALQGVHAVAPSPSAKLPGAQGRQEEALAPPGRLRKVPMGQKLEHTEVPSAGARAPGGHRMQEARPAVLL